MTNVVIYGLISVLPLTLGAYLGAIFNIKEKLIGVISAFGAGAMIAALTFGLMEESFQLGGFDNSIIGFIIGGTVFVIGDYLIIKAGGRGHKKIYSAENTTGWGIFMGAILDGIPESIGLGISMVLNPKLGLLFLVGIIFNNLPEALSSGYDLKMAKKSKKEIIFVWSVVSFILLAFVFLGYTILANISPSVSSTIQAIAAGGVLAMLASTMMPQAYKESGLFASYATILGFLVIFIMSKAGV